MQFPIQAPPVNRTSIAVADDAAVAQSCDIFKCISTVLRCAPICISNPTSSACISCFGPLYNDCISCL